MWTVLQVDLCIEPGQSLGLMIRGGVEYNLGIFVTGVDKDSVADRAGLMVSTYYATTGVIYINCSSYLICTYIYSLLTQRASSSKYILVTNFYF